VGPRAVLDAVVKRKIPSPRRESNTRTPIVQHVDTLLCTGIIFYHTTLYHNINQSGKQDLENLN
jgi:hypothetical protein